MAKILQCSDIHIGACRDLPNYRDRHQKALRQITDIAATRRVPLIIAGDVVDNKKTTHEERYLVDEWFGDLEKKKIETIIITGNHDYLYDGRTQLDGYNVLPFEYVHFVTWEPRPIVLCDIGFICIPWRGYSVDAIEEIVKRLLPLVAHCRYRVVVLHECIVGSKGNDGYVIPKGTKIPDIPDITYWALGDLHSLQPANRANSWYAGAPLQYCFNDDLPKGLIEVDLEHPSIRPTLIPITAKPLKTVKSVAEISDDAFYKVVGSFDEVIEASFNENVIKTDIEGAVNFDDGDYTQTAITSGLAEFLAAKGIGPEYQEYAITWVQNLLGIPSTKPATMNP
jgi:exonuclease SbcD